MEFLCTAASEPSGEGGARNNKRLKPKKKKGALSITVGGVPSGPRTLLGCQSAKPKHLKGNPRKLFYFCFAC